MEDEGLEEWDADFWDQLLQVEELVLSSRTATTIPPPASTSSPPPPPPPPPSPYPLTYSPPPQLSQRLPHQRKVPHSFPIAEQLQIHASTSECLDIRRERDIKEEHTKSLSSNIEVKHVEALHLKDTNLEHAVRINGHSGISLQCQNASYSNDQISSRLDLATRSCKAVGVQTDKIGASTYLTGYQNTQHTPSEHLLAIWGYSDGQSVGRTLLSKLFASCATDFHVLFGSFCKNASTEMRVGSHAVESSSSVTSKEDMHLVDSSDAEKVSHFYFVLTKTLKGS